MSKRKRFLPSSLGFPDTLIDGTDINIISNKEVTLDGCKGILVYENDEIRLRLKKGVVCIHGEELTLKTFFGSYISVRGNILSVSFEEE